MLATFVIGLREGLEAALIVGIIAAFLKKNGHPLRPMWIGVAAGVAISIAVGVVLKVVESALPQRQQEMMETVIGAVAVVFVTGMIVWMSTHARGLKRELETAAGNAIGAGTSRAMVTMAFLAVLKEGFETAVFMLATFQAATNTGTAVLGAALGIGCSVILGIGLYTGGVSLNLGKFFKGTSVFLILIAAGLVMRGLRTAHEAGWLNAGQARTVDLQWLAPPGSVRSAVFTGVLGIPADPRVIEVLGWFLYAMPVALIAFWPSAHRPNPIQSVRLKLGIAAACLLAAAIAFFAVPAAELDVPSQVPVVDSAGATAGSITLSDNTVHRSTGGELPLKSAGAQTVDGIAATHYTATATAPPASAGDGPDTITLADVTALNGGRLPVGLDPTINPGPYRASWASSDALDVWTSHGKMYDAHRTARASVTLTGGGLATPRTLNISPGVQLPAGVSAPAASWTVAPSYLEDFTGKLSSFATERDSSRFWGRAVPFGLLLAAVALLVVAVRARRRIPTGESAAGPNTPQSPRSTVHASPQPSSRRRIRSGDYGRAGHGRLRHLVPGRRVRQFRCGRQGLGRRRGTGVRRRRPGQGDPEQ